MALNVEKISSKQYKLIVKLGNCSYSKLINKIDFGFIRIQVLLNFIKENPQNIIFTLNEDKLQVTGNAMSNASKINFTLQKEELDCGCQNELHLLKNQIIFLKKKSNWLRKKGKVYEILEIFVLIISIISCAHMVITLLKF